MLIPDHGTTPISRSTDKRTQAGALFLADVSNLASPSSALRVNSSARGKKCVRKGARGVDKIVANVDPMVVSAVSRRVASAGEKSAPANTFCG